MEYYVYILTDPRNNLPFYVGKGKGKRALSHLKETKNTTINVRKYNKIQSIIGDGLIPLISYHSINLTEKEAYNLETDLIKQYGRKDYDEGGILLNICEDSKPPGNDNFLTNNPGLRMKGKSYEEIYGEEKAKHLKAQRKISSSTREVTQETKDRMKQSALNKMVNGYKMPSRKGIKDSVETRLKKSLAHKGKSRPPMSEETKKKISDTKRKNSNKFFNIKI
jgi:hypothetical protein